MKPENKETAISEYNVMLKALRAIERIVAPTMQSSANLMEVYRLSAAALNFVGDVGEISEMEAVAKRECNYGGMMSQSSERKKILKRIRRDVGGLSVFWIIKTLKRVEALDSLIADGTIVRELGHPHDNYPVCMFSICEMEGE